MTPEDAALCERLKRTDPSGINFLEERHQSAAAIERLSAENEALREDLKKISEVVRPGCMVVDGVDIGLVAIQWPHLKGADQ